MDAPKNLALCGLGLLTATMAGCVSPYPYNAPYGYGAQPGGYYGQPQYPVPSSVPSGDIQLNAPTPVDSTPSGGSNSDAPLFDSNANKNVPDYFTPEPGRTPDPGDVSSPDSAEKQMYDKEKHTFETDKNPFGMNPSSDVKNLAFEESSTRPRALSTETAESSVEAPPPITLAAGEYSSPLELKPDQASLKLPYDPATMPNPYNYDKNGYRSLQGLVTFDDQTQTWIIMYNDKPEREDDYGGVFTLADNEKFSLLNDYDVVYLEGSVSETEKDAFGKPKYKVDFLNKLRPRAK